ncbi:hypothetical protein BKA93DRAFT_805612 [Sparassis latifolia]
MYASLSSILSVFILVALVSARSIAYSKAKGSLQIAGTAEFEPEKASVMLVEVLVVINRCQLTRDRLRNAEAATQMTAQYRGDEDGVCTTEGRDRSASSQLISAMGSIRLCESIAGLQSLTCQAFLPILNLVVRFAVGRNSSCTNDCRMYFLTIREIARR